MYLQIALATGLRQEFTYLAQEEALASYKPKVGLRVRINFGRSERVGLIVGINKTTQLELKKLKPIIQVLDETPLLPKDLWELGLWAADYYQHPVGDSLMHLLPAKLRQPVPNQLIQLNWQKPSSKQRPIAPRPTIPLVNSPCQMPVKQTAPSMSLRSPPVCLDFNGQRD